MGYPVTDYVQAMTKACQSGFSATGDLRIYKRVVLGGFVLAAIMFVFSLQGVKTTASLHPGPDAGIALLDKWQTLVKPSKVQTIAAATSRELIEQLRGHNLWEERLPSAVPPVVLERYPADLAQLQTDKKKKAFLNTLLPIAMVALSEVLDERRQLVHVLEKYQERPQEFSDPQKGNASAVDWTDPLSSKERKFITSLTRKYRTTSVPTLLRRVDMVPVSLIMAQGAIESSWGTSRFVSKGNNLFGIMTWDGEGIVPADREDGKIHRAAAFDSLLDSVRSYILMLNRVEAYNQFRTIRQRTTDPVALAAGLLNYSERGGVYVSDIGRLIEYNSLRDYDNLALLDGKKDVLNAELAPSAKVSEAGFSFGLGRLLSK
ncbi:MAG: glucosaminidase domain-containing protein [Desulfobulbaceae bacterium]|nr:glucosaminidase domain-containing protein [Desulfobulbaceae bacterium]